MHVLDAAELNTFTNDGFYVVCILPHLKIKFFKMC